MKGDFSQWDTSNQSNINGVLHQQGRVLLDRDWNDQTQITVDWQDGAARQIIGANVAAISSQQPNGFKVTHAAVSEDRVKINIVPGQGWADGLAIHLPGIPTTTVTRIATYFEPPIQDPSGTVSDINKGIRDAVVLEVWREALNGFQMPETLIEPALGGPDTTERVITAMRFRLLRLATDDDCHTIIDKLQDQVSQKGRLQVSLQPTTETDGDCPVVDGGGYTGFEHQLYRVEIAKTDGAVPMFKWSQFNGGLVGRGKCDLGGVDKRITLTANDQAIKMSGLTEFYLEVVEFDTGQGFWRVTYGAEVTLNGDDLNVTREHYVEANLPSNRVFFRLWNGIEAIANFPKTVAPTEPNLLRDGIRLEFDDPNVMNYRPGDYWIFKVRAGEIVNDQILIDDQPPQGIEYHRVPLAELNWNADLAISFEEEQIEDCRDVFRPLTNQTVCCTFTVGDGRVSHGDFDTIEEAVRHLPNSGGKICLLPGLHEANVRLQGKRNIKIEGCGKQTRVIPRKNGRESPIFQIIDSECIALLNLNLVTLGGTAISLAGGEVGTLKDIEIGHNRIIACQEAIHVNQGVEITIHDNKIRMLDKAGAGVAIYLMAEDSLIIGNEIGVIPAEKTSPPDLDRPDRERNPDPTDPCADLEIVYLNIPVFLDFIWAFFFFIPINPFNALGGIQIAGGSERVKVRDNEINGGAGNGIALGSSVDDFLANFAENPAVSQGEFIHHNGGDFQGKVVYNNEVIPGIFVHLESKNGRFISSPTDEESRFIIKTIEPGEYQVSITNLNYTIEEITSQNNTNLERFYTISIVPKKMYLGNLLAFLYEIEIAGNHISNMGLSGIGIPRITTDEDVLRQVGFLIRSLRLFGNPIIDLKICNNQIEHCWQNEFNFQLESEAKDKGFGGISLGIVANSIIQENRIENNGISHIIPTCGIFIYYGEVVEIVQNWIINNGAISANTSTDLRPGNRGGIIALASSIPTLSALAEENQALLLGKPAARIFGNRIDQPVGQALNLTAMGAISINNNHFKSELSGSQSFDNLVGGVFVLNFGGLKRGVSPRFDTPSNVPPVTSPATHFTRNSTSEACLPNGNTLFNSNQTYLGTANTSFVSQLIVSADDIGFDSNQSQDMGRGLQLSEQTTFTINTWLWGATLRASYNRFQEGQSSQTSVKISLLTLSSLMNNTTNNQGDHCILAFNPASGIFLIDERNQVLKAKPEDCRSVEKYISPSIF